MRRVEPRDHGLEYEEDVRPQPRLTRPCAAWRRESRRLPVNRGEITTRSGRHQTSGGSWQRQNRPRRSATKLQSDGLLGKERVQAVPLRGSIIFITTAGIPLIKPENLFKQTKPPLFEPIGDLEQFVAKAAHLKSEIGGRGVGHAVAIELGLKFIARAGISEQELWLQGLGRASIKAEKEQVALAACEWADGDSIAAHYGYSIDLFCTEDCGKSASSPSVLDPKNKKWLSENYCIWFVTLAELAEMVTR